MCVDPIRGCLCVLGLWDAIAQQDRQRQRYRKKGVTVAGVVVLLCEWDSRDMVTTRSCLLDSFLSFSSVSLCPRPCLCLHRVYSRRVDLTPLALCVYACVCVCACVNEFDLGLFVLDVSRFRVWERRTTVWFCVVVVLKNDG